MGSLLKLKGPADIALDFLDTVAHGTDKGDSLVRQMLSDETVKTISVLVKDKHVKDRYRIDEIVCSLILAAETVTASSETSVARRL